MTEIENNGETLMTDYQFKCYKELRDQREEELLRELEALKSVGASDNSDGMTDYQFKCYNELRDSEESLRGDLEKMQRYYAELLDERDSAMEEAAALRVKCETLTRELEKLGGNQ